MPWFSFACKLEDVGPMKKKFYLPVYWFSKTVQNAPETYFLLHLWKAMFRTCCLPVRAKRKRGCVVFCSLVYLFFLYSLASVGFASKFIWFWNTHCCKLLMPYNPSAKATLLIIWLNVCGGTQPLTRFYTVITRSAAFRHTTAHYENTPIQINRNFHLQKLNTFQIKTNVFC